MKQLSAFFRSKGFASFSKWSLMFAILFWTLIYKLSQQAVHLPEFVYVNF
jgi:hypothetical protein